MTYEYKVLPSPTRGQKGKGIKGSEGRFAHALENHMNALAAEGWEFVRAETLPHEERSGLTSTSTTYRSVLVFRRSKSGDVAQFKPEALEAPQPPTLPSAAPETATDNTQSDTSSEAETDDSDETAAVEDVSVALKKRVETLERP